MHVSPTSQAPGVLCPLVLWQVVEDMDSFHFSKLCKECGLVDDKLSTIEVDIIFSKVGRGRQCRLQRPALARPCVTRTHNHAQTGAESACFPCRHAAGFQTTQTILYMQFYRVAVHPACM
jgi:hypothetical protein